MLEADVSQSRGKAEDGNSYYTLEVQIDLDPSGNVIDAIGEADLEKGSTNRVVIGSDLKLTLEEV